MQEEANVSPFLVQAIEEFKLITKELDTVISLQSGESAKDHLFAPECMNPSTCFDWIGDRVRTLETQFKGDLL